MQATLGIAMEAILERHLEQVPPADIALWSLRGLEVLDPSLAPELRQNTLLLNAPGRLLGSRPVPGADTPARIAAGAVAVSLAALFEVAWNASPALRRAGSDRLLKSAFEELFNHLDPYSRYLSPEEAVAARHRRVGQAGLGLRLAAGRGEAVVIAAITPSGPAAQAGLRVGDQVVAISGLPVSAQDLSHAAGLLEGPADTEVSLRLQRGGRRLQAVLVRSLVVPETVHAQRRNDILWLRIDAFSNRTDQALAAAIGAGEATPGLRGLVLDLRGNRGGLLPQAVAAATALLPPGPVAHTAGRHPDAARHYLAPGSDIAEGLPLVVLVDGRTASAAEIMAAALLDRRRAALVGSATMGKGLIQAVVPLPNGGELLVSWSRVLAPSGWPIQALGVLPSLCTSLGAEATAQSLARLGRGESPMAAALARLRAARPPVSSDDATAIRNACPPAEGRDADESVAVALLDNAGAYAAALR